MIHAIVMAGGKGTRFWPLSRAVRAKQFLRIVGEQTLLEQTISRAKNGVDQVWIVGNACHAPFFDEVDSTLTPDHILYEPEGRNTAPCIGWAAAEILKQDPDGVMVVLPSDHCIADPQEFQRLIQIAIELVKTENCLVTLGIKPTFPHTGFGYIEIKGIENEVGQVVRFREKPNYDTAVRFIKSGNFYWNAGIFVWKARTIFDLIKSYIPEDADAYDQILALGNDSSDRPQLETVFGTLQKISIDFAVMEQAVALTRIIPADIGWDDIGSWSALENHWPKDESGNASRADVVAVNSRNNVVYSQKKLVALIDVDDLIVVETDDAILVLPKRSDQKIRELYERLPQGYQ